MNGARCIRNQKFRTGGADRFTTTDGAGENFCRGPVRLQTKRFGSQYETVLLDLFSTEPAPGCTALGADVGDDAPRWAGYE